MTINCLTCGHKLDLGNAYDAGYEGPVKCHICSSLLEIKTDDGNLRSVKFLKRVVPPEEAQFRGQSGGRR